MIFRSRGTLPHIESPNGNYFVTFRLCDSIPAKVLEEFEFEKRSIIANAKRQNRTLSTYEVQRLNRISNKKIESYLDSGSGECWLTKPAVAQLVVNALNYFDGIRYDLHSWCVMPNHVHVLFAPKAWRGQSHNHSLLIPIMHSWKSFTATKANRLLSRTGKFWQPEYFDVLVKTDRQFIFCIHYILNNPVKAGLCTHWSDWKWAGCSQKIDQFLQATAGGLEARAPLSIRGPLDPL